MHYALQRRLTRTFASLCLLFLLSFACSVYLLGFAFANHICDHIVLIIPRYLGISKIRTNNFKLLGISANHFHAFRGSSTRWLRASSLCDRLVANAISRRRI